MHEVAHRANQVDVRACWSISSIVTGFTLAEWYVDRRDYCSWMAFVWWNEDTCYSRHHMTGVEQLWFGVRYCEVVLG